MSELLIKSQPVMWPTARVLIGGEDFDVRVSEHDCGKSVTSPGGTMELTVVNRDGVQHDAIDAFIAAPNRDAAGAVIAKPDVRISLGLGYKGLTPDHVVWAGYIVSATYLHRTVLKISAVDDKPLQDARFTKSAPVALPQQIVEELLAEVGLADPYIDLSLATKALKFRVSDNQTAREILDGVKQTAKIRFPWYFTAPALPAAGGTFVWAPWSQQAAEAVYIFQYKRNIVRLAPVEEDLVTSDDAMDDKDKIKPVVNPDEPPGRVYELQAIPQPWLWAGAVVKVLDHPKAADGLYRVDSLRHRGGAESRTVMTIRGLT